MSNIINKISIKTVCGKVEKPAKRTFMARIFGVISGIKVGESNYGEFTKFMGDFKAVNSEGEEYRAPACFLPDVATHLTRTAYFQLPEKSIMEAAFDVFIKPSESPVGYEYEVVPVIENKQADPLESMMKEMPALPAVKKAEKKAEKKGKK